MKYSAVALSVFVSYGVSAQDIEVQDHTIKAVSPHRSASSITVAYNNAGNSDIDNSSLHLQQDTWLFSARTSIVLDDRWAVSFSGSYENIDFDWGQRGVVLSDLQSWSSVERYKASIGVSYMLNDHWTLVAAPIIQYAFADGTSSSNAKSYGLLTSAMWRFDGGSILGLGLAYLNDINEVKTVPYLTVDWHVNDKWRLSNPFVAGFTGSGGLELSYKLTDTVELGVGSSLYTQRFLVRDDETTMEINEIVSFLHARWAVTPSLSLSGYMGYFFNGELELSEHSTKEDIESQMTSGVAVKYMF